jgi:hypothetical protein
MTATARANVVSSFTIVKGAMIPETYRVLAEWDLGRTKRENLDRLRDENFIGTSSATWLRDVAKVLNRRYDPADRDLALLLLAKAGFPVTDWTPILLWHMTRDEFLVRDFLLNWLYGEFADGALRLRPSDLDDFLRTLRERGGEVEGDWKDSTRERVAVGLLRIAADFGLLRGTQTKEFASFHLPERGFLYVLHALRDQLASPARIIESPEWRMYLMAPQDVERELLRLHQFRKLHYEAAGSLVQLTLPYDSALDYAKAIAA